MIFGSSSSVHLNSLELFLLEYFPDNFDDLVEAELDGEATSAVLNNLARHKRSVSGCHF